MSKNKKNKNFWDKYFLGQNITAIAFYSNKTAPKKIFLLKF